MLISGKELSNIDFERCKKALIYIKYYLIDSDNNVHWILDLLIDINNVMTSSNLITLKKVNV